MIEMKGLDEAMSLFQHRSLLIAIRIFNSIVFKGRKAVDGV